MYSARDPFWMASQLATAPPAPTAGAAAGAAPLGAPAGPPAPAATSPGVYLWGNVKTRIFLRIFFVARGRQQKYLLRKVLAAVSRLPGQTTGAVLLDKILEASQESLEATSEGYIDHKHAW